MKQLITFNCPPELPSELFTFLSYACSLLFAQKPDYDHLQLILLPAVLSLTTVKKEAEVIVIAQGLHIDSGTDDKTPWV